MDVRIRATIRAMALATTHVWGLAPTLATPLARDRACMIAHIVVRPHVRTIALADAATLAIPLAKQGAIPLVRTVVILLVRVDAKDHVKRDALLVVAADVKIRLSAARRKAAIRAVAAIMVIMVAAMAVATADVQIVHRRVRQVVLQVAHHRAQAIAMALAVLLVHHHALCRVEADAAEIAHRLAPVDAL